MGCYLAASAFTRSGEDTQQMTQQVGGLGLGLLRLDCGEKQHLGWSAEERMMSPFLIGQIFPFRKLTLFHWGCFIPVFQAFQDVRFHTWWAGVSPKTQSGMPTKKEKGG